MIGWPRPHSIDVHAFERTTMAAAAKLAPGEPTTVQKGVQYRKDDMCSWYFST